MKGPNLLFFVSDDLHSLWIPYHGFHRLWLWGHCFNLISGSLVGQIWKSSPLECLLLLLPRAKHLLQPQVFGWVQESLYHLPYLLIVAGLSIPVAKPLLPYTFRGNLPLIIAHFSGPSSLALQVQFIVCWECCLNYSLPLVMSQKVCSMQNIVVLKQQGSSKFVFSHNARSRNPVINLFTYVFNSYQHIQFI